MPMGPGKYEELAAILRDVAGQIEKDGSDRRKAEDGAAPPVGAMMRRPRTGPMRFVDQSNQDWAGLFIRGERAFGFAIALDRLLNPKAADAVARKQVEELLALLRSCNERGPHYAPGEVIKVRVDDDE